MSVRHMRALPYTDAQKAVLAALDEVAEWHDSEGSGWGEIAFEVTTGDPVIYVYDEHDAFVLRPDGHLERSPVPVEDIE